jgi:predicted permease
VAQVALSIVIVVAAGLFVQSFRRLASVPPGFDADRVLLVNVSLARANIAPPDRVPFIQRLVREIAAVPGATRVAASLVTPIQGGGMVDLVRVPGGTTSMMPMQGNRLGERSTFANAITPGWFSTYGTPLEAGRDFNESDLRDAPSVIIVNEAFVRKFLRDVNPIGSTVAFDGGRPMPLLKAVVGVVGDAAYDSLRARELPVEYVPLPQLSFPGGTPTNITLNVRAAVGSPMLLVRSISAALIAVNPDLVFTFRSMSGQLSASLVQDQLVAVLSGFFGLLALLLAGLGLYGVTAYAVASRRAEIGIRMALGSSGRRVRRLVLSRVARMVGAGIVIGIGASVWASTFVASLLFGIEPRDMTTLAGAAVVLTALALIATWPAALRASRLDPASVLREG